MWTFISSDPLLFSACPCDLVSIWISFIEARLSNLPCLHLKGEASTSIYARMGEWRMILDNLTAKLRANLDNPIKRYEFFFLSSINFVYVALSGGTLLISVMSQLQYKLSKELYTNVFTKCYFSWKCIFPLLLYLGMLGQRWMCMHFVNELDQKDYQYPRKTNVTLKSQWRVVLLWYHIFWQSSVQRGRHTQLCIITSLKRIIQICSNCLMMGF